MTQYRNNGAKGALLDEYERALKELIELTGTLTVSQLTEIVDPITKDKDCRSIQTILSHVVKAGYTYATHIRIHQGEELEYRSNQILESTDDYITAMKVMFDYNLETFDKYPDMPIEEMDNDKKMKFGWGQSYDVEQIMEHAIVHILRHRRQIERFLLKMT